MRAKKIVGPSGMVMKGEKIFSSSFLVTHINLDDFGRLA